MGKRQERAVTIAVGDGGLVLEGLYVAGVDAESGGAVIAPPHPLYGGSMESPVVSELAYACEKSGLASLRFNWRGVGASGGESSGEAGDADADTDASLVQLEETVEGPIVACGYSFGAAAALRVAVRRLRVRRLVLVSPPVSLLDRDALAQLPCGLLLVTGEADAIAPPADLAAIGRRLEHARFEAVPDADHFFAMGLATVGRVVSDWLSNGE
ncbi:MAG: alpha/beta fold hydrolase [Myxococcota bacterium]